MEKINKNIDISMLSSFLFSYNINLKNLTLLLNYKKSISRLLKSIEMLFSFYLTSTLILSSSPSIIILHPL